MINSVYNVYVKKRKIVSIVSSYYGPVLAVFMASP